MQFQDHEERKAVCALLMAGIGRSDLWGEDGPTDEATSLCAADGGWLSSGERVMLLVCCTLWRGDETLSFSELRRLDPHNLYAVGSLLAALAVDAMTLPSKPRTCVQEWLVEMQC